MTPENTYIRPNGKRECRACKAERERVPFKIYVDRTSMFSSSERSIRARNAAQARWTREGPCLGAQGPGARRTL